MKMKKALSIMTALALILFFSCVSDSDNVKPGPEEAQEEVETEGTEMANPQTEASGAKYCALTFDDGPDLTLTPLVLDKLKKHGIVASFFLVGQRVNESVQPLLQSMVAMGCELNNHSWGYGSMNNMSADDIKESVGMTTAAIEKYAGVSPAFFRPPNLAVSAAMYEAIDLPFAEGVLGMDWAGTNTDAEQRAQNVLNGMRDGAIILLHDVQPAPHPTPEALDILIPELLSQGYVFVTLSRLFEIKGVDPNGAGAVMWKYVE